MVTFLLTQSVCTHLQWHNLVCHNLRDDAAAAEDKGWKGYANKLSQTADSQYLFPSKELLDRCSFGRQLTTDDEKAEWDSIFGPISAS